MIFFLLRCFAIGIGSGVSTELVDGIARAGRGAAEYVLENERLQTKVSLVLKEFVVWLFVACGLPFYIKLAGQPSIGWSFPLNIARNSRQNPYILI